MLVHVPGSGLGDFARALVAGVGTTIHGRGAGIQGLGRDLLCVSFISPRIVSSNFAALSLFYKQDEFLAPASAFALETAVQQSQRPSP